MMIRVGRFFVLGTALSLTFAATAPVFARRLKPPAELVRKPSQTEIQVGSVRLRRCKGVPAYCGAIIRALYPSQRPVQGEVRFPIHLCGEGRDKAADAPPPPG